MYQKEFMLCRKAIFTGDGKGPARLVFRIQITPGLLGLLDVRISVNHAKFRHGHPPFFQSPAAKLSDANRVCQRQQKGPWFGRGDPRPSSYIRDPSMLVNLRLYQAGKLQPGSVVQYRAGFDATRSWLRCLWLKA